MSRVTSAAKTPKVRALASALVAATALLGVPASTFAAETDPNSDARLVEVQQAVAVQQVSTPAVAPKKIVANFTARTSTAIRATRSASLFRWGTPAYAKWYAKSHIAAKYQWGAEQFGCLVSLWNRESHWGFHSTNSGGRTYGIPQTNKRTIVAFGTTFATYMRTPEVQVQVGSKYINYRYGSPCEAWKFSERHGWY